METKISILDTNIFNSFFDFFKFQLALANRKDAKWKDAAAASNSILREIILTLISVSPFSI